MVYLMKLQSSGGMAAAVKTEIEDSLEDEHGPFNKRSKHSQEAPAAQYNPLDEPSPLGLRLRKSPSLLELIQMRLSQGSSPKKEQKAGSSSGSEKLKASNFPATILRIGTWEYKSRYEGDLVAKCYFAKHKLVWEVLDGGLKNKIEIQWSDIMGLKATYPEEAPGTLDVVLARQPLFFRETNPQPRKHTLWQATSDFTGGQASIQRRHFLQCPQGLLGKHFEKLIQCDPRLNFLSQQKEIVLDSPYFEPRVSVFDDISESRPLFDLNNAGSPSFFSLRDAASPSGGESFSSRNENDAGTSRGPFRHETPSPSSVMDMHIMEEIKKNSGEQWKELSNWDQIKVPGLHNSMSMSDLVSHLETRVSEQQGSTNNVVLSSEKRHGLEILDEINLCLFSEPQYTPVSDEKSLMTRVNSLCCLLQRGDSYADLSSMDKKPDFTGGQASIQRRHFLQCPQGLLGKHFEKLIQCDPRLNQYSLSSPRVESPVTEKWLQSQLQEVVDEIDKITPTVRKGAARKLDEEYGIDSNTLHQYSDRKLEDAARILGLSRSTLKRICRKHGIKRWPPCKTKKSKSTFKESSQATEGNDEDQRIQGSVSNLRKGSPSKSTALRDARKIMAKVSYEDDIVIKFEVSLSSTKLEFEEKVALRLKLAVGSFSVRYKDEENEWIFLACDEDLRTCINASTASGNSTTIRMKVGKCI